MLRTIYITSNININALLIEKKTYFYTYNVLFYFIWKYTYCLGETSSLQTADKEETCYSLEV